MQIRSSAASSFIVLILSEIDSGEIPTDYLANTLEMKMPPVEYSGKCTGSLSS